MFNGSTLRRTKMALILPTTLSGDSLGERHRRLNLQVNEAATAGQVSAQDFEALTEQTAVDRLIKIDIAIKLKNVDYIVKSLKDDDMLYVSRALKCKWLLERRDIVNPNYLEDVLYPQMVLPAISKFKHWLYINLSDPVACQEFYEYYKNIKFDFAVKFLRHCDNEFLLKEFPKVLTQINPHYLKVLGEKCPKLVKIYYDSFSSDNELVKTYLKDEQVFYKSIIFLLKSDPEVFLDITEKYHNLTTQSKLTLPVVKDMGTNESHVFHDQDYEPIQLKWYLGYGRMAMRNKCCAYTVGMCALRESDYINHRMKSELEKLFDEFRFVGFNGTLHELRGRINAVSSADRRRDMLLVLVSKSGGRPDCVREMLQFALRFRNEPVHERAAIVRSLVKRANVWRLPQDVWDSMLEYGQGLGLDGTRSEAQCREGLHAVVLRQLLTTGDCVGAVRSAFLEDFSTLEEYKLNTAERAKIADGLQHILTSAARDAKPEMSSILLHEIVERPNVKLARPLATLAGKNMESIIQEQDLAGKEHHKLAAALRANIHRARPAPDALALGWRKIGMKAVAWRAIRCRPSEVTQLIQTLLQERVKRTVRLALVLAQRTTCVADIFSTAVTIRPLAALRAALPYYRILGEAADPRVYDIVKPYIASVDLTCRQGLRRVLKNYDWLPIVMQPEYCAVLCLILDKVSDRDAGNVRRYVMKFLPQVSGDLLKNVLTETLKKVDSNDAVSFPAIVIRYLMLSESDEEETSRFEQIGQPFLEKITAFRQGDDDFRSQYFKENLDQIMSSLKYNAAFFDIKYNHCLVVIERVLAWLLNVLTKETHFEEYAKIHATMLYYKAIRQSMKQKPEIFDDPVKKQTEGVDVVGSTFGRYIVKEVALLKSNYFDSVMELYRNAFTDYLSSYFVSGASKGKFIASLIKGMLSESVGSEARLAVHILQTCQYNLEDAVKEEINEICLKSEDNEVMFFMHAEIFA
ncbi:unnamed protein product [Arctia plantaginis]|uniref:Uncharacterized protein n=1 Tax=Arctia plantaginis TaxID=874455 RepID=A0A8S0ZSB2_ARCPL|nr:unnamed protein product [Arctia plantaginis]